MTFCIAWSFQDAVCVVADSVRTVPGGRSQIDTSTFGDLQTQRPDAATEEGTLKIIPLHESGFITFSGSVAYARAFVRSLLDSINSYSVDKAMLRAAHETSELQDRGLLLEVLVGLCPGGVARLLRWTSVSPGAVEELPRGATCALGNMAAHHRDQLLEVAAYAAGRGFGASTLPMLTATLQIKAMQENLISSGIGGACVGAWVGPDGFRWQDDTTFVLYTPRSFQNSDFAVITTVVRDNVPVIASGITRRRSVFFDDLACSLKLGQWQQKWALALQDELGFLRSRYFAFLSRAHPRVTVVESPDGTGRTGLFILERVATDRVILALNREFQAELLAAPLEDDGQRPLLEARFIAVGEQPPRPESTASLRASS